MAEQFLRGGQPANIPDPGWMSHSSLARYPKERVKKAMLQLVESYGWETWKKMDPPGNGDLMCSGGSQGGQR